MLVRQPRTDHDGSPEAIRPGDPVTIQWDPSAPVLLADSLTQAPDPQPPDDDVRVPLPQR